MNRSRRAPGLRVVSAALLAVVVAGCSASSGSTSVDAAAPTGATGPALDQTVVALDDFAALALLTLGVTPDLAFDTFGYESTRAVLEDAGVSTRPYGGELDLEAVAGADPDVLVGVSIPTTLQQQSRLEEIAPTTVLEYTDPWQEQLRDLAASIGREERAEQVLATVEEQVAGTRDALAAAGRAGAEVSVVGWLETPFAVPAGSGVGPLLTELGLERPPAQQAAVTAGAPFLQLSEEQLSAHDADHLFLLAGGAYDSAPLTSSPLWPGLRSVQSGELSEVSAEVWFSASAFATSWVAADVRRVLVDGAPPRPTSDAVPAFQEFLAEVSGPTASN